MKEWKKINLGGKTKEEFEKGEIIDDGKPVSAEKMAKTLDQIRKIRVTQLKAAEEMKDIQEVPKNLEEIEFIGMVQLMISKERERLGLLPGFHIELESTRLFHPEVWKRRGNQEKSHRGEYKIVEGLAEAQTKAPGDTVASPYAHFRTISHEILHQSSCYEADPVGGNMRHRLGYFTGKDGLGRALNEAMTEGINQQLLGEHADTLGTRFSDQLSGGRTYKWWSEFPTYQSYQKIVGIIAQKVDDSLYYGVPTTWDNLERGYFDGDQKALGDIEKALGKEALELLLLWGNPAIFNTTGDAETSYINIESQIERYLTGFSSPGVPLSPEQKEQIYHEVLSRKKNLEGPVPGDVINK